MNDEDFTLDISVADIVLADYMVLSQTFEIVERDNGSDSRKSDIDVKLDEIMRLSSSEGEKTDSAAKKFASTVVVSVAPTEEASFYRCQIAISGLFVVASEDIDDSEVRKHIALRGTQELYDIIRVHLAQITANGVYGTLMLPSVKMKMQSI